MAVSGPGSSVGRTDGLSDADAADRPPSFRIFFSLLSKESGLVFGNINIFFFDSSFVPVD